MNIELRQEQPSDYQETENVTREAFWDQYTPGCDEHYLIHIMRDCPAFVPELDSVAVLEGRIIGNVVCMKAVIKGDDGNEYEVLSLGPISVLPDYQCKGVGGQMISYTKKRAREMGFRAILLFGDPDYYLRQGFAPAEALGIRTADHKFATALHVCELFENALLGIKGCYLEDAIYEVDQADAARFDESYPKRESVIGTPSQKRFQELSVMQRSADC